MLIAYGIIIKRLKTHMYAEDLFRAMIVLYSSEGMICTVKAEHVFLEKHMQLSIVLSKTCNFSRSCKGRRSEP